MTTSTYRLSSRPVSSPRLAFSRALSLTLGLIASAGCSMAGEGTGAGSATTGLTTGEETETATETATETGGTETTDTTATIDTSESGDGCGDGEIGAGEVCDGDALDGKTCVDLGAPYIGGELGCAPSCDAFDASSCDVDASAPSVKLNELLAKGASEGPYLGKGDIIELYNAGGAAADLSGWKLSDELTFPGDKTYVFPEGSTLAAGAWLVLVEYDDVTMEGDFPFGVSSSKEETILLADASGVVVDSLTFDGALAEVSLCRIADGEDNWVGCFQTPGEENVLSDVIPAVCGDGKIEGEEQCDGDALGGQACVDVGDFDGGTLLCSDACTLDTSGCTSPLGLVLNELSSSDLDPVELVNAGDAAVDLSGWILTDDITDPYEPDLDANKMLFADGASIAVGEYLVVEKGDAEGMHPFGLGGGGDTVRLFNADLELVDSVTYGDTDAEVSYCRAPDGPGGAWMADCVATFGGKNP